MSRSAGVVHSSYYYCHVHHNQFSSCIIIYLEFFFLKKASEYALNKEIEAPDAFTLIMQKSEELPWHWPHITSEIYWLGLLEEKEDVTVVSCSSGRKWWEVMADLLT